METHYLYTTTTTTTTTENNADIDTIFWGKQDKNSTRSGFSGGKVSRWKKYTGPGVINLRDKIVQRSGVINLPGTKSTQV